MDSEGTKSKTKVKYDYWFLIVLAVLLWTLANQMFSLTSWLPGNWANFNLWGRIAANFIAIFGVVWVTRMYVVNTRRQAKRKKRIATEIEKHPELEESIKRIMGG